MQHILIALSLHSMDHLDGSSWFLYFLLSFFLLCFVFFLSKSLKYYRFTYCCGICFIYLIEIIRFRRVSSNVYHANEMDEYAFDFIFISNLSKSIRKWLRSFNGVDQSNWKQINILRVTFHMNFCWIFFFFFLILKVEQDFGDRKNHKCDYAFMCIHTYMLKLILTFAINFLLVHIIVSIRRIRDW